jgi:hypothetical protein
MQDPKTLVLLHLNEPSTIRPADSMGNLAPLDVQDAFSVWGTSFQWQDGICGGEIHPFIDDQVAMTSTDLAGRDTLATRDCTVQWLAGVDDEPAIVDRPIYSRGKGFAFAASETISMKCGVKRMASPVANHWELWCEWETVAGAIQRQASATFIAPLAAGGTWGQHLLFTVTRHWSSPTSVTINYYVNDSHIGTIESDDGDIGGATTGTTIIGGGYASVGNRNDVWPGFIDELKVTNFEMSAEEVRATYRRLVEHQPNGVAVTAAMMPPGSGWIADPGSRWGKLVIAAGQGIGYAISKVDELRETWLPNRCGVDVITQWEQLYGAPFGQLDALAVRRARVVGLASRDNGYSPPLVQDLLADSMNVDASNIQILEYSNHFIESFTTLEPELWWAEPSAAFSISGGALAMSVAGATNARWNSDTKNSYRCITTLSNCEEAQRFCVIASMTAVGATADTVAGICLFNFRTGEAMYVGECFIGERNFGYAYYDPATGIFSNFVELDDESGDYPGPNVWWKVQHNVDDDGVTNLGDYTISYSATGPTGPWTDFEVLNVMRECEWVGLGVVGTDSSTSGTASLSCTELRLFEPKGNRPLNWYAYAPGAAADLNLANLIVRRVKPAHTHAAAITSKSLLCDDATRPGCDYGPMGGL